MVVTDKHAEYKTRKKAKEVRKEEAAYLRNVASLAVFNII